MLLNIPSGLVGEKMASLVLSTVVGDKKLDLLLFFNSAFQWFISFGHGGMVRFHVVGIYGQNFLFFFSKKAKPLN